MLLSIFSRLVSLPKTLAATQGRGVAEQIFATVVGADEAKTLVLVPVLDGPIFRHALGNTNISQAKGYHGKNPWEKGKHEK